MNVHFKVPNAHFQRDHLQFFPIQSCEESGGDITSFVQKKHGLGFHDALEYLKRHYGGEA